MEANLKARIARGMLAAVLACGLMMPSGALAAEDQGSEASPATLEQPDKATDAEGQSADEGDQPGGSPTDFDAAPSEAPAQTADDAPGDNAVSEEKDPSPSNSAATPQGAASRPSLAHEMFSSAHKAATTAVASVFASAAASPQADSDGWTTVGALKVKGGVYGKDYRYTSGPMQYQGANYTVNGAPLSDVLEILTNEPLIIADAAPFDPANAANASLYGTTAVAIREGTHADLTFDGVHIRQLTPVNIITNSYDTESGAKATDGSQVRNRTSLHLTLADGSHNALWSTTNYSAPIHCGEGSDFTLDDSVRNIDKDGNQIIPIGGIINEDVTLVGGKHLEKGQIHSVLDSANPGTLLIYGVQDAASIGGNNCESGGRMTFNGGIVTTTYPGDSGCAAGIGAGSGGNGTDTLILFNSGNYTVAGGYHGAGVGAACYDGYSGSAALQPDIIASRSYNTPTAAGDITINGGYIRATGGGHGNGFGAACWSGAAGYNSGHTITVTGGTLYPTGSVGDLGGYGGYVVITGGSVYSGAGKFVGVGNTAWGNDAYKEEGYNPNIANDPNKVSMMTINLKSEIEKRNNEAEPAITDSAFDELITSWTLTVGGKEYEYGAPKQFFDGQMFLWLPSSAFSQEVIVTLKYIDKNGQVQTIEPLFRQPTGTLSGTTLKRYIFFELPENFRDLTKYYDGTPLVGLSIDDGDNKIPTDDGKVLTNPAKVKYKYQLYSTDQQTPLGVESKSSEAMPSNVGYMKLTVDSTEWCDDPGFSTNYWGHRAIGWCEIKPTNSAVNLIKATWNAGDPDAEKDASDQEDATKNLTIDATISHGTNHPDGTPLSGDKCQAPRGYVQLYVDGNAVGDPVRLVFAGDADENGSAIPDGDPRINATATPVGNGSRTDFKYTFVPAEKDFLLPDATTDNRHIVSLQYLPPIKEGDNPDPEPANYLASVNPAEHPEAAPKAEVAVEPIAPKTEVGIEKDPDNPDSAITTSPYDPDKPEDPDGFKPYPDPPAPSLNAYAGTITTVWDIPTEDNPHPGRVVLNVKTPSTGAITIAGEDGELFDAEFLSDENGTPIRNADGTYSLVIDPKALGTGKLVFQQKPNGAYTGSIWSYKVVVSPNPKIPPKTSVTKAAENLTSPGALVQPGQRIKYTITARNDAAGSAWNGVVLSDRLPSCLQIDEATLRLDNPTEQLKGAPKAAAGTTPSLGEYVLSAPDGDGRRTLSVNAGRIHGAGAAVLTFECVVSDDAAGEGISSSLQNIASATGTRPDPDIPGGELPENPRPSDPATPPKSPTVAPADPKLATSKIVENVTTPDALVTRKGDVLRYRIELANEGAANSCLVKAIISDPLPKGMDPVAGSIAMVLPDGTEMPVEDNAFDKASRTIAVTAGDLWGGQAVALIFDVTVGEAAIGANNVNVAHTHGSIPSKGPDSFPEGADPSKPAPPPTDDPVASTPPATPPVMVADDPTEGDVKISKTAENLTSDDGQTRVGDEVRYTITLANDGPGTAWMDAIVKDTVPEGIEVGSGTIEVTFPTGATATLPDSVYDVPTRVLAVPVGHVYGGQTVTVTFIALVTESAVGVDIGNVAEAVGDLPSTWNPGGEHPEAGKPFSPPDGWPNYDRDRPKVQSDKAYPPGGENVSAVKLPSTDGGRGAGDDGATKTKPIDTTKLAQTGDAAPVALALAILLASSLALLASRRRRHPRG